MNPVNKSAVTFFVVQSLRDCSAVTFLVVQSLRDCSASSRPSALRLRLEESAETTIQPRPFWGPATMTYGHFDDQRREYVITNPLPPRPWINYLGNRRLSAFISQNAGGLLWHRCPSTRRISRYHYVAAPPDRPGFYVYVRDRRTGEVWNPHFAPTCTQLDAYECRHGPGLTHFTGTRGGAEVQMCYAIPPGDEVMLWRASVRNVSEEPIALQLVSYLEFGLLEFMRETIGWCYLRNQLGFHYDADLRAIRYDYHVFEAPFAPRMVFGCSEEVSGFDCSRDAFVGRTGSLARPAALETGKELSASELPLGGHGCGALGVDYSLEPGASRACTWLFALGETWEQTDALLHKYGDPANVDDAVREVREFWRQRLGTFEADTGDKAVDRSINIWGPYNSAVALEFTRRISTDHMGTDGLRYRDTMQDALAVANFDPRFAEERIRQVFEQQTKDGGGCFAFFPDSPTPTSDEPRRSDNTVWPVYTVKNLVAETGDLSFLEEEIPYRDGGAASVYEHMLLGLRYIHERRGPNGLPTLYHADWNDGLALFQDEAAQSVMLAMQLVHSCREFQELAERFGREADVAWCESVAKELTTILNSDLVWDGEWYRRLLLSDGKIIGSRSSRQGKIYLNPQSWAVISGVGSRDGRGATAMRAAARELDSEYGIRILHPPFVGIPEPEDPPLGSNPGIGENGGIFCHANTWAIIAEAMLGNGERAFRYYRQLLPEIVSARAGADHYGREPYVCVSSIIGPVSDRFGEGGISWLTGTASWMYIAVTQYLLGIRPTLEGLSVRPCLPSSLKKVRVRRLFRGCLYDIEIDNESRGLLELEMDGKAVASGTLPPPDGTECKVKCRC